jgi:hypothetical protein
MIHRIFLSTLGLSIISSGISISLAQGFFAISLICNLLVIKESRGFPKKIALAIALLFGWQWISTLGHFFIRDIDLNKAVPDLKDAILALGILAGYTGGRINSNFMKKSFMILFGVLIVSGFISIFSEKRLAYIFYEIIGKKVNGYPYQHPIFHFGSIQLYSPIGFLNTHLTYGGILQFFSVFVLYQSWISFGNSKSIKHKVFSLSLCLIYFLIFIFNHGRSSFLGASFSIMLFLIILYFDHEKAFPELGIRLSIQQLRQYFIILTLILFVGVGLAIQTDKGKNLLGPFLGEEKHTDSGRVIIWKTTLPLVYSHPFLGVGAGNFNKASEESRKLLYESAPELYFFFKTARTGHAHNDALHLAVVFGLPAMVFFFYLAYLLFQESIKPNLTWEQKALFISFFGFFFAGMFQCYFQDDEVVLLFWVLAGFMLSQSSPLNHAKKYP